VARASGRSGASWVAAALAALAALATVALGGCEILVTFDPVDAATDVPDVADDGLGDVEVPDQGDAEDGPGPDGDADADDVDGETPPDGDGETGDSGAVCGNGVVEPGEDCEGTDAIACDTSCGRPGTAACLDCRRLPCATADIELCNAADEDCDGLTDEDFACIQGRPSTCTASCGSTGNTTCSATCTLGSCTPPLESCNGRDDDCDTVPDNGFSCVAGATVTCTTSCGTTGTGSCTSSCNPPAAADCSPPAESCNNADDDCDTLIDEGLWAPGGTDVRVTTSPSVNSIRPSAAWRAGTRQYGVVYEEETTAGSGGEIYFTLLDDAGGDDLATDAHVSVTASGVTHEHPALAWNDAQWAVVWSRNESGSSDLHFRWLSGDGVTLGGDVQATSAIGVSNEPYLTWTGTEYGVVWNDARDGNREIYFARLTTSGSKPAMFTDQRLTATSACVSSRPSVAWTGTEFGTAWYEVCPSAPADPGDVYFTRITAAGVEVPGSERGVVVHSGASSWPRLVWNGTGYGMVWLDDRDGGSFDQLYFARLNTDGVVIGAAVPLTTPTETSGVQGPASLAWDSTRREYLVAWSDQRNAAETCGTASCGTEIYFVRVSAAGTAIGAAVRATVSPGISITPWLANRGDGYGVVWADERDAAGGAEIYFNTLGCR
jgi:hypothetical protein